MSRLDLPIYLRIPQDLPYFTYGGLWLLYASSHLADGWGILGNS
jgi:hypothetical protein